MAEEKHPIRNGITIGVGVALILYLATFIPGLWNWFSLRLQTTGRAAWRFVSGPIPVWRWLILLLILGCIPGIVSAIRRLTPKKMTTEPKKSDYREDTIFGVIWRWDGYWGSPMNLWCFCANCQTRLVYREDYLRHRVDFYCELCRTPFYETVGDKDYAIAQAARQIERKFNTGEWKAIVLSQKERQRQAQT